MKYLTEHSQYEILAEGQTSYRVKRLTTGETMVLDKKYVHENCYSDDPGTAEKVTLTELRNFLEEIPHGTVFVATYRKKDEIMSPKVVSKLKQDKLAELEALSVEFEEDGFDDALEAFVIDLLDNPITTVIPGEIRTMIAAKTGRKVHGGLIEVVDLESLTRGGHAIKTINPQTVTRVTFNGQTKVV